MKIVIITRGRVGKLHTLRAIPKNWLNDTVILCPEEEVQSHKRLHPQVTVICENAGQPLCYSEKFHRIVNGHYPELGRKILIMDDDLRFSMRDPEGSPSLVRATEGAISDGLYTLAGMLNEYPLVGLHPRAMGNNAPPGVKECTRINAMQGVNLDFIGPVTLNHWPILADMVLNLTLLTRGQKTAVWCELFWDQAGASNAPGGCSLHRTQDQQTEAVYGLHNMFPDVVTIQMKEVKKGWFGGLRADFRIQWQKAYKLGVRHARG